MASKLPQITIIGAGLSGLTLGLSLKSKGIAAVLYERATSSPRYNYGITLYPATYRPLLRLVDMDEASFRQALAVDDRQGGVGRLSSDGDGGFRCRRGRLQALLGRSLSIQWGKKLQGIETPPGSRDVTAVFEDGHRHETACLIGCDGSHSRTRQSLPAAASGTMAATREPEVLPYVVFNGRRRMPLDEYLDSGVRRAMGDQVLVRARAGEASLEVSINDVTKYRAELSYIYSRRARTGTGGDALYNPDRPSSGAGDVPEAFYEELGALQGEKLEAPFAEVFDADRARKDRVLHWLMRSVTPEAGAVRRLAERGVLLIGDAAHTAPILGGRGAQVAIQDGLELAEYIASSGVDDLGRFAESRFEAWKKSMEDSKERIADLHAGVSYS